MSMSTYPCMADTVDDDFIKEICPNEYTALIEVLKKYERGLDDLGDAGVAGDMEAGLEEMGLEDTESGPICDAYVELCDAFKKITDLVLDLQFHNAEDRGDDVDGYFWAVEGVYVLSPAGEKYKDKIERKGWTVWG